jgi:hypothetical protein
VRNELISCPLFREVESTNVLSVFRHVLLCTKRHAQFITFRRAGAHMHIHNVIVHSRKRQIYYTSSLKNFTQKRHWWIGRMDRLPRTPRASHWAPPLSDNDRRMCQQVLYTRTCSPFVDIPDRFVWCYLRGNLYSYLSSKLQHVSLVLRSVKVLLRNVLLRRE